MIVAGNANSQTCAGSIGDPVKSYDFGRGPSDRGPAIPDKTNYEYDNVDVPNDGQYAIIKTTAGMSHVTQRNWLAVNNHTPNDPDGYMMLINADEFEAGLFYQETITGLCPGTTYDFGAWIINVMAKPGIRPNVRFIIETTSGAPIKQFDTNPIPEGSSTDWKRYSTTFTTGANIDEVVVKIMNNGLGGGGNDFALDDITFSICGPTIIPSIDGIVTPNKSLCIGETRNVDLSAEPTPGVYTNPQYLWQEMDASGVWQDMPTETTNKYTRPFVNAAVGSYKYRLLVAENGNINSPNCRANSPTFELNVSPLPAIPIANEPRIVCVGDPIQLSVSNASSYKWTFPDGSNSDQQSPIINNATANMAGTYTVTVTNDAGCEASTSTTVTVVTRPVAIIDPVVPICKGSAVTLNASGGNTYRWVPANGLSATDIPNPEASPAKTTTYTVYASNGSCESSAQITVEVFKDLVVTAGPDIKIIKGNKVDIKGTVRGDNIGQIFWTPADYLDDPFKLNPIAKPPVSTTYTLNVLSSAGCTSSTDEVFVKVYEKLIVPNSFSPNGDGVNDIWNIIAIDTYANPKVKIMNRYGQLMFQSDGYGKPWDGKHENQDVPAGVYYYMIYLEPGLKPLTGSLMVIR
ncbi:gliding motility-associated C-terminal domain-containing protein [Pedobacter sp. ok626]|uniref:T9SS type B sorting domain-containing protein n=1 Tax=Pedobacter sp. ok626 TaxID=1761882 RepID=UPI000B86678D|nr:gliding motility-associated C-terminal domain-containing protein [Pedobacter sp. ok626]